MAPPTSGDTLLDVVEKLMRELHPEATTRLDISLESSLDRDLGLDSLARIELLARLEKEFNISLPEHVLTEAETPRDLLHYLGSSPPSAPRQEPERGIAPQPSVSKQTPGVSRAVSLTGLLDLHTEAQPEAEHIRLLLANKEESITYKGLRDKAVMVAATLRSAGIEPRKSVAIMLPTGIDYFHTFFGILYSGAVPVPLYPPARPTQLEEHIRRHRKILSNAEATLLITVPEVKPIARLLMGQVPVLKQVITLDELYTDSAPDCTISLQENDIAFLQYTSGSTGDPKGVVLSHGNLLANIRAMGAACRVTYDDVFVSWLPLYHDMGLIGAWFGSLYHGCRLVIMPPLSFLARPIRWLKAIDTYRGTLSAAPNFGYELCITRINDEEAAELDLSSWRMAFNGAEPVSPDTLRRFDQRFRKHGLSQTTLSPVYGLAESSVGLAFPPPDTPFKIDRIDRDTFSITGKAEDVDSSAKAALEFVNCGRPLPGHQIRIIDQGGREQPEGRQGRLQFKGPSSTTGYYKNPEENRKLFDNVWLDSGDMAYIRGGDVYITGRKKDIIIRGGRNVYPHEIEDAVSDIPGIRKSSTAVFGTKEETTGTERLIILTESRRQKPEQQKTLKQKINAVLVDLIGVAADTIIIAPPGTVLKTSSGKIRRSACRNLYETKQIGKKRSALWLQMVKMGLRSTVPLLRRGTNRVLEVLYGIYCWSVFLLAIAPGWLGVMISPEHRRWKFCSTSVNILCRLTGLAVRIDGTTNIPAGINCLFASNHMSYLDSIILTGALPVPCCFVAKSELKSVPLLNKALKKLDVHFVDRFNPEKAVDDYRLIEEGIVHGKTFCFFVEGTLQRMPGLLPFQMGAFVTAAKHNLPVIPVIIRGTRNVLRGGSWFPRRGTIQVSFGEPCTAENEDWEGAIDLRQEVRKKFLDRLGEPDLGGEYVSLHQMELKIPDKGDPH